MRGIVAFLALIAVGCGGPSGGGGSEGSGGAGGSTGGTGGNGGGSGSNGGGDLGDPTMLPPSGPMGIKNLSAHALGYTGEYNLDFVLTHQAGSAAFIQRVDRIRVTWASRSHLATLTCSSEPWNMRYDESAVISLHLTVPGTGLPHLDGSVRLPLLRPDAHGGRRPTAAEAGRQDHPGHRRHPRRCRAVLDRRRRAGAQPFSVGSFVFPSRRSRPA